MQNPDPTFSPLISISSENSYNADIVGTSLQLKWSYPKIDSDDEDPDKVGDGGDQVTSFLIEWSKESWDNFTPSIWNLTIGNDPTLDRSHHEGSFCFCIDLQNLATAVIQEKHFSADIPVDFSVKDLTAVLQNMHNIGAVEISEVNKNSWQILFSSEVGNITDFYIHQNSIVEIESEASIPIHLKMISACTISLHTAYESIVIQSITEHSSLSYVLKFLIPGQSYFVRMAAYNQVGFSARRVTAPVKLAPPVQKPGSPASLFDGKRPPILMLNSATSLIIKIGPPLFDGGAFLTFFIVEWDLVSTFDLSNSGSTLQRRRVAASNRLCNDCVTSFNIDTHTFSYVGNDSTVNQLITQRKIAVYFSDDKISYTFEIMSASKTQINVFPDHKRRKSIQQNSILSESGFLGGSDLYLLGIEYKIDNLVTGYRYFVRVSAENNEMGSGIPVLTYPSSEIPHSAPIPPYDVKLSVVNKSTLHAECLMDN